MVVLKLLTEHRAKADGVRSQGEDCDKAGVLTIEAEATFCDNNDCEASWIADSTTGGFFYVIITVALADQGGNHKILYDLDPTDSNDTLTVAKNCKPPVRTFNCVDTDHPDFDRGVTYPLKFLSDDPRGSYR